MDPEAALGGLDGVGAGSDGGGFASLSCSDPEAKHELFGSGPNTEDDDEWRGRSLKMARTGEKLLLQQSGNGLVLRSGTPVPDAQPRQQQMLCFSSSTKSDAMLMETISKDATLPYFHHTSPASYARYSGYSSESANGGTILTGVKGPFTPSQWMELEHQALIYKYVTANMPIPSNLLNPIKRALDSVGFPPFSSASLAPTTLGWGSIHLGFSNSTDPEPGRCRRTDGKKWRCSKDAVADAKYCERHMNRGRHRSRKPVEGRTGHSSASTTATTRLLPVGSSSMPVVPAESFANVHQVKNPTVTIQPNRVHVNKENVGGGMENIASLSALSPTMNSKPKENAFSISKQQPFYEGYSQNHFGLVSSDSLLNPSQKSPSFMDSRSFGTSQDREPGSQHLLRPFTDNWPKPEMGLQSDQTQLSISTPLASSSFMSTSSPTKSKVTLSPLRLSCEMDPIQMGLGVGNVNERNTKWNAVSSWGTSVGGPLGEVLHSTSNSSNSDYKNSSALNPTRDGWDVSPRLESSPTGVLQKTAFGSLSNSSAGSSPRTHEGALLCNDMLGTAALVHSSSLPLV